MSKEKETSELFSVQISESDWMDQPSRTSVEGGGYGGGGGGGGWSARVLMCVILAAALLWFSSVFLCLHSKNIEQSLWTKRDPC